MNRIRLTAENETIQGDGVCRLDGKVTFVWGMLAGETGLCELEKQDKKLNHARLAELENASDHRISPACPYHDVCGGCALGHMTREHELAIKEQRVEECLERLGNAPRGSYRLDPITGGEREAYRGKVEVIYQNGFGYVGRNGKFCPVKNCLLMKPETRRLLEAIERMNPKGLRGAVVRTNYRGESLLVLTHGGELGRVNGEDLAEYGVTSLWMLKQKPRMTHALDGVITHLWGDTTIEEEICGLTFQLSPKSFFQINRDIAAKLYTRAVELAKQKPHETAIDAYCGVGAIGMLAAEGAGWVFGVELIPDAVEDAKLAAKKHGIQNINFVAGRCEVILPRDESLKNASVIFLDPPRKGCGKELLDAIAEVGIPRVVYVSCDPATLARDVAIMKERGYNLTDVAPYDMFPQTGHVETVCLLSKK
ncbi:MAG: 23S rRNA (uracil(1939)-C(5))-methyltransferase RlmD [Clostridia bacterium]|nr:23S rRNA (uracil(1939)-C(5))-methyltransferase RlmD [Clostridia bacterium]